VLCFCLFLSLYMAAALFIAFSGATDLLGGDGVSRVEIADRMLFSRDPHLAAIGFVWSPLPVVALLPLVALKPIWPFLVTGALAGNIVSAIFMAGAVVQMLGLLGDLAVGRRMRWALTVAFALQPMIILYAANAMSEAPLIFFLLLVVRRLYEWLRFRQVGALAATGFFLALGYLTRYEAAAAAVAVTVVVAIATLRATRGDFDARLRQALVDVTVVIAPFLAAFASWAIISWVITGSLFEQFTSSYGNQVQLQTRGIRGADSLGHLATMFGTAVRWAMGVEPFLGLALIACVVVAVRHRNWATLAVPTVLGAVVAFMAAAFVTGKVDEEMRYFIVTIPLTIVTVGIAVGERRGPEAVPATPDHDGSKVVYHQVVSWRRAAARWGGDLCGRILPVAAVVAMATTILLNFQGLTDPALDTRAAVALEATVNFGTLTPAQRAASSRERVDLAVSRYVDSLNPGPGTVLLDDFLGFVIVMTSTHQDQYVITSDTDFEQILADPSANGVKYVLIPEDTVEGTLDAVNRAYPGAYATGKGIGKLVETFHDTSDNETDWRLYRISAAS
jgi:4-amino-4-deoxy-L-arabinose transferase-like glycosyltransferase